MKQLLLIAVSIVFICTSASAQMLPPAAMVKCTATKDVETFIRTVRGLWLTAWHHSDWEPSKYVKSAYNLATRENEPCEALVGWDKVTAGRFLAVKNFENRMVQIDISGLEKPDVDTMRKYVSENGFKKGFTSSYETWETKDVVVEIPNTWEKSNLKISVYAKIGK